MDYISQPFGIQKVYARYQYLCGEWLSDPKGLTYVYYRWQLLLEVCDNVIIIGEGGREEEEEWNFRYSGKFHSKETLQVKKSF